MGENGTAALVMGRWTDAEVIEAFREFSAEDMGTAEPPEREALRELAWDWAGESTATTMVPAQHAATIAAFQAGFLVALQLVGELNHELLGGRAS